MDPADPLAALHALPEAHQRAIREAYRNALFRWLDRLAAEANADAAQVAAHQSEPEEVATVAA